MLNNFQQDLMISCFAEQLFEFNAQFLKHKISEQASKGVNTNIQFHLFSNNSYL